MGRPAPGQLGVLALPRDPSPYQAALYAALAQRGYAVRYVGELTPSHTANVALLPFELLFWRLRGWRILHLHWVFFFALAGGATHQRVRRLGEWWFGLVLGWAKRAGLLTIWTAHNVLPHDPVFADDRRARRRLVAHADLVLAHSQATLDALVALGAVPRNSAVIPLGSFTAQRAEPRPPRRPQGAPLRLLFFGRILPYKGVEELFGAVAGLSSAVELEVVVAGDCPDAALREQLTAAAAADPRIDLRIGFVPDDELAALLDASHLAVLPFRAITTSSSVMLAFEHGRTVVVPDLPAFAGLPAGAVVRYDGSVEQLTATLAEASTWTEARLAELGAAATSCAPAAGWEPTAEQMDAAIRRLCSGAWR